MPIIAEWGLQELLYYQAQNNTRAGFSPAAPLLPLETLRGEAPSGLSSPAQTKIPKTLLLTQTSLQNPYIATVCSYLKNTHQFTLYYVDTNFTLHKFSENHKPAALLPYFDESAASYGQLLQLHQLERDKLLVLQNDALNTLVTLMKFYPVAKTRNSHHGFLVLGLNKMPQGNACLTALNACCAGRLDPLLTINTQELSKKNPNSYWSTLNAIWKTLPKVEPKWINEETFLKACLYEHLEMLTFMIAHGADVNHVDKYGHSVLVQAIRRGNLEITSALIAHGADVNHVDKYGDSVLAQAIRRGNLEITNTLIAHGADVNHVDKYGDSVLVQAICRGNLEITSALIAHGANVKHVSGNFSALDIACAKGGMDVTRQLLEVHKKPNLNRLRAFTKPSLLKVFDFQVLLAEKKKVNPNWKACDDLVLWNQMCQFPGEIAWEATRDLRVAHFLLQRPELWSDLTEIQWRRIFMAHPKLTQLLSEGVLAWHKAPESALNGGDTILHLELFAQVILSSDSKLPNLQSLTVILDKDDSPRPLFIGRINELFQKTPSLSQLTISAWLQTELTLTPAQQARIELRILQQWEKFIPPYQSAETAVTSACPQGYLYACQYDNGKLPDLTASDNINKIVLKKKPLFKVESTINQEVAQYLQDLQRMATGSCFALQGTSFVEATIISPKKVELIVPDTAAQSVVLRFLDPSLLGKLHGYLIFPVLSDTQQLIQCSGGEMWEDASGRWLFKQNSSDLTTCRIQIALSLDAEVSCINANNMRDTRFNTIPNIAIIRGFFEKGTYQEANQQDISCCDRVRGLFRHHPEIQHSWQYGANDIHAYLIYRDSHARRTIKVDLGGGGVLGETYAPPPSPANASAAASTDIAAMDAQNATVSMDTLHDESPKVLYYLKDSQAMTALLVTCIRDAKKKGREIFLARTFSQLDISEPTLKIAANAEIISIAQGLLGEFLAAAHANSDQHFQLLIDLSNFSLKDRVRINSILDDTRRLQGVLIPDNVQVVMLDNLAPTDPSFIRRFNGHITARKPLLPTSKTTKFLPATCTVDLCAFPNWEQTLWGPIVFQGEQIVWQRSELAERLIQGAQTEEPQTIVLDNLPEGQEQAIRQAFDLAIALGYWNYQGYRIPLGPDDTLKIASSRLELAPLLQESTVTWLPDVLAQSPLVQAAEIINTYWFDRLISEKRISEGAYHTVPGVLEQHAGAGLCVYVTSVLSTNQWYSLFFFAKKYQVNLRLLTATGVSVPLDSSRALDSAINSNTDAAKSRAPTVIVTNHANRYFTSHDWSSAAITGVLDVEDLSYQDLIAGLRYQTTPYPHDFSWQVSGFLEALQNPAEHWVLKGKFSEVLLGYLTPLLVKNSITLNGQEVSLQGKLTLIVEVENPSQYKGLTFLPELIYAPLARPLIQEPQCIKEPEFALTEPFDLTQKTADAVIANRKQLLTDILHASPWCQMVGETGVGKSELIQTIKNEGHYRVYSELESLPRWAEDQSAALKVLFVDESNIEDMNFTFLAPLAKNKRLLYKGNIYHLSDEHKVVFARNPMRYGGGRLNQRLFDEYAIPLLELHRFHPACIYRQMLLPIYKAFQLGKPTEKQFEADCQTYLSLISEVRELQQHVFLYCFRQKHHASIHTFWQKQSKQPESPSDYEQERNERDQQRAQYQLKAFLALYQFQKKYSIPQGIGLNGFLLTGDPGIGKSRMIKEMVTQTGLETSLVKLDISLPQHRFIHSLIEHMEAGHLVWIDEIDVLADVGLEKVLNALLNGRHPFTHQKLAQCGKILATGNGATYAGRGEISKALKNRCVTVELSLKSPSKEERPESSGFSDTLKPR